MVIGEFAHMEWFLTSFYHIVRYLALQDHLKENNTRLHYFHIYFHDIEQRRVDFLFYIQLSAPL